MYYIINSKIYLFTSPGNNIPSTGVNLTNLLDTFLSSSLGTKCQCAIADPELRIFTVALYFSYELIAVKSLSKAQQKSQPIKLTI